MFSICCGSACFILSSTREVLSAEKQYFFEASLASAVDFESVGMYPDTGIIFRQLNNSRLTGVMTCQLSLCNQQVIKDKTYIKMTKHSTFMF